MFSRIYHVDDPKKAERLKNLGISGAFYDKEQPAIHSYSQNPRGSWHTHEKSSYYRIAFADKRLSSLSIIFFINRETDHDTVTEVVIGISERHQYNLLRKAVRFIAPSTLTGFSTPRLPWFTFLINEILDRILQKVNGTETYISLSVIRDMVALEKRTNAFFQTISVLRNHVIFANYPGLTQAKLLLYGSFMDGCYLTVASGEDKQYKVAVTANTSEMGLVEKTAFFENNTKFPIDNAYRLVCLIISLLQEVGKHTGQREELDVGFRAILEEFCNLLIYVNNRIVTTILENDN